MKIRAHRALIRVVERWSPIVIRDLRRRARTRSSTGMLIGLQVITALMMLPMILVRDTRSADGFDVMFWLPLGFLICLGIPGLAAAEMRAERSGGLMELTLSSGISPRLVLWGKWGANVVFIVLAVVSLVPYGVVRYFLGGVDLVVVAQVMATLAALAALLLAVAIALSVWHRLSFTGVVVGLGGLGVLVVFSSLFSMALFGPPSAWGAGRPLVLPLVVALAALSALVLMEAAVGVLAHATEQEAWLPRLLALVAALLGTAATRLAIQDEPRWSLFLWAASLLAMTIVASLCGRRPAHVARMPRLLGWSRVTRAAFLPGWESGAVFAVVSVVIVTLLVGGEPRFWLAGGILGALLMPLPLAWALRRRVRAVGPVLYTILQVVLALPAILYGVGRATETGWMATLGGWLVGAAPLSFLLIGGAARLERWEPGTLIGYGGVSLVVALVVTIAAVPTALRREI